MIAPAISPAEARERSRVARSLSRAVNGPNRSRSPADRKPSTLSPALLQESGCRVRALDVSIAFHSPDMEAAKEQLIEGLNGLEPARDRRPSFPR